MKKIKGRNVIALRIALVVSLIGTTAVSAMYLNIKSLNEELVEMNTKVTDELVKSQKEVEEISDSVDELKLDFIKMSEKYEVVKTELEEEQTKVVSGEADNAILKEEVDKLRKELNLKNEAKAKAKVRADEKAKEEKLLAEKKTTRDLPNNAVASTEVISRGNDNKFGSWSYYNVSAYTAKCNGCSGITKTGKNVSNQSIDHRVVAVDPSVIPLGSLVEVEGMGTFTALDTGGAIKGNKIDILMQSKEKAYSFGRKDMKVRVLRSGY